MTLGVLSSCTAVVGSSQHVAINDGVIETVALDLLKSPEPPGWDADLHFRAENDEHTAMWLLALDALNFCFWGQGDDPSVRWRVRWKNELVDGYVALVAALTKAMETEVPLHSAQWLADVSANDVAAILAPEEGHTEIPLFDNRVSNLRELGRGLLPYGANPASTFISAADGSAVNLVRNIVETFPSFNDVTVWPYANTSLPENEVRFYKRAQILVGDIAGGLAGSPLAEFHDLEQLTAFADYKVPQILRELGVLEYDDHLAALVDNRHRIPAGSREEVEIRAATIVACDRFVQAMRQRVRDITAGQLDWHLWSLSQHMPAGSRPYHLTETIFY